MKTDAAGLEAQLGELNDRWHSYLKQCWLENSQTQSNLESSVYILNYDSDGGPSRTFFLNNEHALKKNSLAIFLI
jgi:predicted YcjX-like family ATPase